MLNNFDINTTAVVWHHGAAYSYNAYTISYFYKHWVFIIKRFTKTRFWKFELRRSFGVWSNNCVYPRSYQNQRVNVRISDIYRLQSVKPKTYRQILGFTGDPTYVYRNTILHEHYKGTTRRYVFIRDFRRVNIVFDGTPTHTFHDEN